MSAVELQPRRVRAVIFDMDGVLTETATVHEAAWAKIFDRFLAARPGAFRPFSHDDYLRHVDGKPRLDGVRDFLAARGIELPEGSPDDAADADTVHGLGRRKNDVFREVLETAGATAYADAVRFLDRLEASGVSVAAISASRNAEAVLRSAGIRDRFAVLVDGVVSAERGITGKPAPDIFLEAAADLGVAPGEAVVAEDAVSGIRAGKQGGFALVLGIARNADPATLREAGADAVVDSFDAVAIGEEPRQ
jgi:beta-phosphoglucomutase family hydrolase